MAFDLKPSGHAAIPFSRDQLDCICIALFHAREGQQLLSLFMQFGEEQLLSPEWRSEPVLIGYIYALYHAGQYERLFATIASNSFSEKNFKDLQNIWYSAHYKENESKRQKELGAVEKKHPPPRSIWDGQETVYSFKENSRKVIVLWHCNELLQFLKQFYKQNQYPNLDQKREISRATELELVQISNWFKNRRQRDKTSKHHKAAAAAFRFIDVPQLSHYAMTM